MVASILLVIIFATIVLAVFGVYIYLIVLFVKVGLRAIKALDIHNNKMRILKEGER